MFTTACTLVQTYIPILFIDGSDLGQHGGINRRAIVSHLAGPIILPLKALMTVDQALKEHCNMLQTAYQHVQG